MTQLQAPTDTTISLLQQRSKEMPMVETSTAETEMVEEPMVGTEMVEEPKIFYPRRPMARVTSKGQITIPKAVREELGISPGDTVEFTLGIEGTAFRRMPTLEELRATIEIPPEVRGKPWKEIIAKAREAWAREAMGDEGL